MTEFRRPFFDTANDMCVICEGKRERKRDKYGGNVFVDMRAGLKKCVSFICLMFENCKMRCKGICRSALAKSTTESLQKPVKTTVSPIVNRVQNVL